MSSVQAPVSDMLVTVKSREIQRGMLAEKRGDRAAVERHLQAAAYLELVLAEDYAASGQDDLSVRSKLSAATCLWRAGQDLQALVLFEEIVERDPARAGEVREIIADLQSANAPNTNGQES